MEQMRDRRDDGSTQVTEEMVEAYLLTLREKKVTEATRRQYEKKLRMFYRDLPEDKRLDPTTLPRWRAQLKETYSAETVNTSVVLVNGFLEWLGRRDCQVFERYREKRDAQPELTREEYHRLLRAAKEQGNERSYLLVKVFATTGLAVQELPKVTVQAVRKGQVLERSNGTVRVVPFPRCLREELLAYAEHSGIASGEIFRGDRGCVLARSAVNACIHDLCGDAQVAEERATPRCLRKLYTEMQNALKEDAMALVNQSYERLLDSEQAAIGWK